MPYETTYVEPEVFLTHGGVTVWHAYDDDDLNQPYLYIFCLSGDDQEARYSASSPEFDVRELPTYRPTHPPHVSAFSPDPSLYARWRAWQEERGACADAREAIIAAIDQGLIRQDTLFRYGKLRLAVAS